MSNNSENTTRAELEIELLSCEIDRLVVESELKRAQADMLQLELEEMEAKNLEGQGNAEADKLISDAKGQSPLADWEKELLGVKVGEHADSEGPECDCPDGTCLGQLLAKSMANHPAGKAPRRAAAGSYAVDKDLNEVYLFLDALGAAVYGKGDTPKTVAGLAQALVDGRATIVLDK